MLNILQRVIKEDCSSHIGSTSLIEKSIPAEITICWSIENVVRELTRLYSHFADIFIDKYFEIDIRDSEIIGIERAISEESP